MFQNEILKLLYKTPFKNIPKPYVQALVGDTDTWTTVVKRKAGGVFIPFCEMVQ